MNPQTPFRTKILSLILILGLLVGTLPAGSLVRAQAPQAPPPPAPGDIAGPGWHLAVADPVAPDQARQVLATRGTAGLEGLTASETEATPEITALARALDHDPKLIFDYVHNHVEYVPNYGSLNGATATYYAGRANDCDQASLCIALLRAAGYTAEYAVGDVEYEIGPLANWVGTTASASVVGQVFASGGVPGAIINGPDYTHLRLTRVWVRVQIGGTWYTFDPAMKQYQDITGLSNLGAVLGYDQAAFLSHAAQGATVTTDYVQNLNEANVRSDLATYSMNLVNYIRTHLPTASLAQVISGREIIPTEMTTYPTALPYALAVTNQVNYATLPASLRHTLRVQYAGMDRTFATFEIAARRVTIFYDPAGGSNVRPVLRVDGTGVVTGSSIITGTYATMTVTVDHPYAAGGGAYADQWGAFYMRSGAAYALMQDWNGVSPALLTQHTRTLNRALCAGYAANSEPVLGQSLALLSLQQINQVHRFTALLGRVGGALPVHHHTVGVLKQETGYGMDIQMDMTSLVAANGATDTGPLHRARGLVGSALEHGVLEQMQGSAHPAVSTIKLLYLNNLNGDKTYLARQSNWATVKPSLTNYYPPTLASIEAGINAGYEYVLPEDGDITLNDWHGAGYIRYASSGGMGMLIWGGYGGASGKKEQLNPQEVAKRADQVGQRPDKAAEINTPQSDEPVDMTTGAYIYDSTDLVVGSVEPLGLRVGRSYNSGDNYSLGPLGYGWRHNYELSLSIHSDPGPGLGLRQPTDAAALIAYAYVVKDVLAATPTIPQWATANLATKWAMDQLTDNAVTIGLSSTTLEYTRLADGSYNPPPGLRQALVKSGANYVLQGSINDSLTFGADGKAQTWQDANGNALTFAYDGGGRLQTVTDAFGRTFTYGYTGERLTSITSLGGRTITYVYTANRLTTWRDAENRPWSYGYDADNRLTTVTHPKGNTVTTNTYDTLGRVATQADAYGHITQFYFGGRCNVLVDPDGHQVAFVVDGQGRLAAREDEQGRVARLSYDGQGRPTVLVDRLGDATQTTYDAASGKWASYTDAAGHQTTFSYVAKVQSHSAVDFTYYYLSRVTYADGAHEDWTYDAHGNVTAYTDQTGRTWTYTYNARGQLLTATNPQGGVTTYTYNTNGALASATDADVGVTTFGYDTYQRLNLITRPGGSTVSFTYDLNDRLRTTTDELGRKTTLAYDTNGNLVTATDPLSQTTTYAYDLQDRLASRTDPASRVDTLAYDNLGRPAAATDRNGNTTTYAYDSRGWLNAVTDPAGQTWDIAYDDEGVPTAYTTPLGRTTAFQTDELGRATGITDPLLKQTTFAYDAAGRLTSRTDRLGRTTTYAYDAAGRLAGVTEPIGAATYAYNPLGLLSGITDPRGKQWSFGYSAMGRPTSQTDPLGRQWAYAYDTRGRLAQITYPGGGAATFTYDAASQVTQVAYPGGPTLNYTYDAAGRLLTTNNLTLAYDVRGDVTNSQDGATGFGASYDHGQRLKTVTYAGQATVTYTYNTRDRLTRVEDSRSGAWMNFAYDDDGRLTGITRANGVDTVYTYDAAGRVTRIHDGTLGDQQYTLNAEGEPTQVARTLPLDPPPTLGAVSNLTYDDAHQISSPGYAYDARGRQTAAPGRTFAYDGAGRLTQVISGGVTVTLTYNGLGDLRTRTEGGATTTYYHNYALGLSPIVAEQAGSTFKRFYVYTPDGALLYSIDPATNQVRFYHFDQVGSTLFLTDGAGDVSDAYAYDPYGNLLGQTGTSDQPFTYVGQYGVRREPVGHLYDMRARAYDPTTIRFLTRDPLWPNLQDPSSLNPYQYAYQNPLRYLDPMGTEGWDPGGRYVQTGLRTYVRQDRESGNKFKEQLSGTGVPPTVTPSRPPVRYVQTGLNTYILVNANTGEPLASSAPGSPEPPRPTMEPQVRTQSGGTIDAAVEFAAQQHRLQATLAGAVETPLGGLGVAGTAGPRGAGAAAVVELPEKSSLGTYGAANLQSGTVLVGGWLQVGGVTIFGIGVGTQDFVPGLAIETPLGRVPIEPWKWF